MIPKPSHRQYYTLAERQRERCPVKMLTVLDIVEKIISRSINWQSHHYYYQKLLTAMGFDGSSEIIKKIPDHIEHKEDDSMIFDDGKHIWNRRFKGGEAPKKLATLGVRLWMVALALPLFLTNSYALTLIPQPDGNYTIIDGARVAKDLPEQTIIDDYNKYHSEYWNKVNILLTNSKKYRWNRGKAKGGNFK